MKIAVCLTHNTIYHISNAFYGSSHTSEIENRFVSSEMQFSVTPPSVLKVKPPIIRYGAYRDGG